MMSGWGWGMVLNQFFSKMGAVYYWEELGRQGCIDREDGNHI